MVDFYGKLVGKYTSPKGMIGVSNHQNENAFRAHKTILSFGEPGSLENHGGIPIENHGESNVSPSYRDFHQVVEIFTKLSRFPPLVALLKNFLPPRVWSATKGVHCSLKHRNQWPKHRTLEDPCDERYMVVNPKIWENSPQIIHF